MTDSATANKRRTTGIIAGITGLVMLMGGTSFALWAATDDAGSGQEIWAGDINLAVQTPVWHDITGRTDEGGTTSDPVTTLDGTPAHLIDTLLSYHVVPGDTVQADIPMVLAMQGDNLVAAMHVDAGEMATTAGLEGLKFSYEIVALNDDGTVNDTVGTTIDGHGGYLLKKWMPLTFDTVTTDTNGNKTGQSLTAMPTYYFEAGAEGSGVDDSVTDASHVIKVNPSTTANPVPTVALLLRAHFSEDTTGRTGVLQGQPLTNLNVTLSQVKPGGIGNFPTPAPTTATTTA